MNNPIIKFKQEKGDSFYHNFNEKLKKKLNSIPWPVSFDDDEDKTWTVGEIDGDETKCTHGKNIHYIKNNDLKVILSDIRLKRMNVRHNPAQAFIDQHGVLYHHKQHFQKTDIKYHIDEIKTVLKGIAPSVSGSPMSHFKIEDRTFEIFNEESSLKLYQGFEACYFDFTEDYDFQCRDINIDFAEYTSGQPSYEDLYDKFKQRFTNMETVWIASNKIIKTETEQEFVLYTPNFCYVVRFFGDKYETTATIIEVPKRVGKKGYQLRSGEFLYKLPSLGKLETCLAETLFLKWEESNKYLKKLKEQFQVPTKQLKQVA